MALALYLENYPEVPAVGLGYIQYTVSVQYKFMTNYILKQDYKNQKDPCMSYLNSNTF